MRKPLHDILCEILGSKNCYFEPPSSVHMEYPCIRYSYSNDDDAFADNRRYLQNKRYMVTIIDTDPDSRIPGRLKELSYCRSDRNYSMDGLSHFVFTLYYNGPRVKEVELVEEGDVEPTDEWEN